MRLPFSQLRSEFHRVLLSIGFNPAKAEIIANTFAQNSLDGVYSHGINRFPEFIAFVKDGTVDKNAEPIADHRKGPAERYNGNLGAGVLNAHFGMDRAVSLAKEYGIGCVAIRNTNHWMRGGAYGWQAANAGCIGICFTNTIAIMTPWGGTDPTLGNNPIVIAVPRSGGHVVLDMAVSQYSFGKINEHNARGEQLSFDGGYDASGNLTKDPATIMQTKRALPIGFWKGSGLALVLDLLATLLSGGRSTGEITAAGKEYGVSQVFICIENEDANLREKIVDQILEYTRSSPAGNGRGVSYPGENTLRTRIENTEKGIPVDETIWHKVLSL